MLCGIIFSLLSVTAVQMPVSIHWLDHGEDRYMLFDNGAVTVPDSDTYPAKEMILSILEAAARCDRGSQTWNGNVFIALNLNIPTGDIFNSDYTWSLWITIAEKYILTGDFTSNTVSSAIVAGTYHAHLNGGDSVSYPGCNHPWLRTTSFQYSDCFGKIVGTMGSPGGNKGGASGIRPECAFQIFPEDTTDNMYALESQNYVAMVSSFDFDTKLATASFNSPEFTITYWTTTGVKTAQAYIKCAVSTQYVGDIPEDILNDYCDMPDGSAWSNTDFALKVVWMSQLYYKSGYTDTPWGGAVPVWTNLDCSVSVGIMQGMYSNGNIVHKLVWRNGGDLYGKMLVTFDELVNAYIINGPIGIDASDTTGKKLRSITGVNVDFPIFTAAYISSTGNTINIDINKQAGTASSEGASLTKTHGSSGLIGGGEGEGQASPLDDDILEELTNSRQVLGQIAGEEFDIHEEIKVTNSKTDTTNSILEQSYYALLNNEPLTEAMIDAMQENNGLQIAKLEAIRGAVSDMGPPLVSVNVNTDEMGGQITTTNSLLGSIQNQDGQGYLNIKTSIDNASITANGNSSDVEGKLDALGQGISGVSDAIGELGGAGTGTFSGGSGVGDGQTEQRDGMIGQVQGYLDSANASGTALSDAFVGQILGPGGVQGAVQAFNTAVQNTDLSIDLPVMSERKGQFFDWQEFSLEPEDYNFGWFTDLVKAIVTFIFMTRIIGLYWATFNMLLQTTNVTPPGQIDEWHMADNDDDYGDLTRTK
jgi:hypothetical protein